MPRKQKKYHYIYKTTCQITGKFYVGMHSTDDLEDGYLGSGKILGYSIGKHGRENHKKEILEFCETRGELKKREAELVNEELLDDPMNINLKYGGEGGFVSLEASKRGAMSRWKGHVKIIRTPRSKADALKARWQRGQCENFRMKGVLAAASSEAIEKRRATFAEHSHMQGEKNSQFGTCWVTKGVKPVKIKKEMLDEYLINGYHRGRK
jgi:hypothetical protein